MTRVLILASGKGGTGKTSVTAGLGCALAMRGKRTLLIDADAGMQSLDMALGVYRDTAFDFADAAAGTISVPDAAVPVEGFPLAHVLAAPTDADAVEDGALYDLVRSAQVQENYDYVLIDAPAGVGHIFREAARAAHTGLVVATPDPICLRSAEKCAQKLASCGAENLRLIVNRVRRDFIRRGLPNLDDAIDGTGTRLIGYIPEDASISLCGAQGVPVLTDPKKRIKTAFANIAGRLLGEEIPLMKYGWF